eukprot:3455127-Prymnesium_polylepis.1
MPSTACCTSSSFANAGVVAARCMATSRASCCFCSSCVESQLRSGASQSKLAVLRSALSALSPWSRSSAP